MSAYKTYTLDNNSVIKWRRSIDDYYKKGLPAFGDARTIRIMLDMTEDWIKKDRDVVDSLKESGADAGDVMDWIETFAAERVAMQEIEVELTKWLESRNLPR